MLASAFVAAVRRQGAIPTTYTTADILGVADIEVRGFFVPLLESMRQNFLVRTLTATPDVFGRVPLPSRAVGASLRNVQLQTGNAWRSLPQRALEDADSLSSGQPAAYFLDAGSIQLLPQGSSGILRIRYGARPGQLVLETDTTKCQRITGVTIGSNTTTLALAGAFTGGAIVDVVAVGPAHQQKVIDGDYTGSVIPNASFTEAPIVGDYLCAADYSPFVPLPEELASALIHRTTAVILRGLAYEEEAQSQWALAGEEVAHAAPMLTPRNEGNPQIVRGGFRRSLGQGSIRRSR